MSKNSIYQVLQVLQNKKKISQSWNITWSQGVLLSSIVSTLSPKKILEIGTSNGFSALWMIYGSPSSFITTIDINDDAITQAKKNFEIAKCSKQITCVSTSLYYINKAMFSQKFEFIFVDALQQEYENVVSFILENLELEKQHSFLFDNVLSHKKATLLEKLLISLGYETILYQEGSGFLLATKYFKENK